MAGGILKFVLLTVLFDLSAGKFDSTPRENGRATAKKEFKCRLVWQEYNVQQPILESAVQINVHGAGGGPGQFRFVARGRISLSDDEILIVPGTYHLDKQLAFFAYEEEDSISAVNGTSMELLTNPHECRLEWRSTLSPDLSILVDPDNPDVYVGKVFYENSWLSGGIDSDDIIKAPSADGSEVLELDESIQYLVSRNDGIEMEITLLELDEDLYGGPADLMGEDVIRNEGPSSIFHTITHSKQYQETTNVTISETWTSTYTTKVTTLGFIKKKTKTTTTVVSRTETKSVESIRESDVSVVREVHVPPYTSVRACSTVSVRNNFQSGYHARAVYTAKGMTPQEVKDILDADDVIGEKFLEGEGVTMYVSEHLVGDVVLTTNFIVVPLDDPNGCNAFVT